MWEKRRLWYNGPVPKRERPLGSLRVRPLKADDLSGVSVIERQAFPTLWPPTGFKRELNERLAKYLVVSRDEESIESPEPQAAEVQYNGSRLGKLLEPIKARLTAVRVPGTNDLTILGFVGLWFISGEAHITSIAVEESMRGRGIGELLLISSIEIAMERSAKVVSLEARVSNHVAQSLYAKYGFQKMGIRRAYYNDNREDAVIMTTDPINNPEFLEQFRLLREVYQERHGKINISLT